MTKSHEDIFILVPISFRLACATCSFYLGTYIKTDVSCSSKTGLGPKHLLRSVRREVPATTIPDGKKLRGVC